MARLCPCGHRAGEHFGTALHCTHITCTCRRFGDEPRTPGDPIEHDPDRYRYGYKAELPVAMLLMSGLLSIIVGFLIMYWWVNVK